MATGQTETLPIKVWSKREGDDHRGGAYAVSADGRLVASRTSDRSGTPQIAVHDRAGGETAPVTAGPGARDGALDPLIPADGRFVLFAVPGLDLGGGGASGHLEIVAFDREAGAARLLTAGGENPGGPGSTAAHFSADGRTTVVETSERFDADEAGDLYVFANPIPKAPEGAPPVAEADRFTVAEDGWIALDRLANDHDPDGDHLVVVETEGPAVEAGSLWTDEAGVLRSAPGSALQALAPGETGTDRFTHTVRDASGLQTSAAVTIAVTGVDDAPSLNPDVASARAGGTVPVEVADLRANDFDAEGGPLDLEAVSGPVGGTLTFDAATQFLTFAPDPGAFRELAEGQSATEYLTRTVRDAHGAGRAPRWSSACSASATRPRRGTTPSPRTRTP